MCPVSYTHLDCGIAEENMMGVAAGLSTMGYVPFVSSFAMFAAGRAFEQVRNSIGYPHPVSYTHLTKNWCFLAGCSIITSATKLCRAFLAENMRQDKSCLLYTSRCV